MRVCALKWIWKLKLPINRAAVVGVSSASEIWRELSVTPPWIDFFFAVVRWAISVLPSRLREGGDFINAVASTDDGALDAFNKEIGSGSIGTVTAVGALPDTEGLCEAVHDVSETTAELAAPVEVVARRRLDVCHCCCA